MAGLFDDLFDAPASGGLFDDLIEAPKEEEQYPDQVSRAASRPQVTAPPLADTEDSVSRRKDARDAAVVQPKPLDIIKGDLKTLGETAQDIGVSALKIGPTALEGIAQIGDMLTGGNVDLGVQEYMKRGKEAIDEVLGSEKLNADQRGLAKLMKDDSKGFGDWVEYAIDHPKVLVDQSITTIGSMLLPIGVAGTLSKGLRAAAYSEPFIQKAVEASTIGTTMAQNAASTFAELEDKPLADRLMGASVAATVAGLVGVATRGGAEGAVARRLTQEVQAGVSGSLGAAKNFLKSFFKAGATEAGQEFVEEAGNIGGEMLGGNDVSPAMAEKRLGSSAVIGGIVGEGAHVNTGSRQLVADLREQRAAGAANEAQTAAENKATAMFSGMKPAAPGEPAPGIQPEVPASLPPLPPATLPGAGAAPQESTPAAPAAPATSLPTSAPPSVAPEPATQAGAAPTTAASIEIDPANPAASIAAIAAAPITQINPGVSTPAGVDPTAHANAAGDLAAVLTEINGLRLKLKIVPPAVRPAIAERMNALAQQARQTLTSYSATFGTAAGNSLHRAAAEVAADTRGSFDVQIPESFTNPEQAGKVNAPPIQIPEPAAEPLPAIEMPGATPEAAAPAAAAAPPAAVGVQQVAAQQTYPGSVEVRGIHYGTTPGLTTLSGAKYGTGASRSAGEESERLKTGSPGIRQRTYFYEHDGLKLPEPEGVVTGTHAYEATIPGLLDIASKPAQDLIKSVPRDAQGRLDLNAFEEAVLAAGYSGYKHGPQIVTLGRDVPVRYLGTRFEALQRERAATAKPAPATKQDTKTAPTRKHVSQAYAPTAVADLPPALQKLMLGKHDSGVRGNNAADGGKSRDPKTAEHKTIAGILRGILNVGLHPATLEGISAFHVYTTTNKGEQAHHSAVGTVREFGIVESVLLKVRAGNADAAMETIATFVHETWHNIDNIRLGPGKWTSLSVESPRMAISLDPFTGERVADGDIIEEAVVFYYQGPKSDAADTIKQILHYPIDQWMDHLDPKNTDKHTAFIQEETLAQLHALWYTAPAAMKQHLPIAAKYFEDLDNALQAEPDGIGIERVRELARSGLGITQNGGSNQRSQGAGAKVSPAKSTGKRGLEADDRLTEPERKKAWAALTPKEQRRLNHPATAKKFVDIFLSLPSVKDMAAVAWAGRAKKGWYRASAHAIHHVFGHDAPRFAVLLASTSPQTSVESNLKAALQIWTKWVAAGRPVTHSAIRRIATEGSEGTSIVLETDMNNIIRSLTHPNPAEMVISGPKVDSFYRNLTDNVVEVTNDSWMASYAGVRASIFGGESTPLSENDGIVEHEGKRGGYIAMNAKVRQAAKMLTKLTGEVWTPAEVQETIWSWAKTLYEMSSTKKTAVQILNNKELTDALISATPDFGSLFTVGEYASILQAGGFQEGVDRLAEARRASDEAAARNPHPEYARQTAPFAERTQSALERQAAKRLDATRERRAAERAAEKAADDAAAAARAEAAAAAEAAQGKIAYDPDDPANANYRDFYEAPEEAIRKPGWFIITATQEGKSDDFNLVANQDLATDLKNLGYETHLAKGMWRGVDQGTSYLVFGPEAAGLRLAKKYGQQAITTTKGFEYADGRVERADHDKDIFGAEATKQDGYTILPTGTAVSMGFEPADAKTSANAYSKAPDNLMGLRRSGPQKQYGEQKGYKRVVYVRVTHGNGMTHVDAMDGLNGPHAMERARRNWPDAEITQISKDEAVREDPGIADAAERDGKTSRSEDRSRVTESTKLAGDGRQFTNFFTAATEGERAPDAKVPYVPVLDISADIGFTNEYVKHRGNFDDHIATSIPGFREVQQAVGAAIVKSYPDGANLLDIAASEGAFNKAITATSGGKIKTLALDPNLAMAKFFREHSTVPGAEYEVAAFGSAEDAGKPAWTEDDGTVIKTFDPKIKYDVVHEAMGFQFISNTRNAQFARSKEMMTPDGIALFEEKVIEDTPQWKANEAKKDAYKARYYTAAQLAAKKAEVLEKGEAAAAAAESKREQDVVGMHNLMTTTPEFETALSNNWKHVAQYWDSGNFKGYVASDSREALERFLSNLTDLNSEYSTIETPATVKGDAKVSANRVTDTPAFKIWFAESKIVDANGNPLRLYHGTPTDFEAFDWARLNKSSDWGQGIYLTNTPDDASFNYAGVGPDMQIKIDERVDQLMDERNATPTGGVLYQHNTPEFKKMRAAILRDVKKQMAPTQGLILPLYARMENPVIVGGPQETLFFSGYEGTEEVVDGPGTLEDLIESIQIAADEFNADPGSLIDEIVSEHPDGISASELRAITEMNSFVFQIEDENGEMIGPGAFLSRVFQLSGFDGIVDNTVDKKFGSQKRRGTPMKGMVPTTTHYIVFSPMAVKSATGNAGTFDPTDARVNRHIVGGEQSPSWKRWFKKSKVVNKDGSPQIVYHATRSPTPFDVFDTSRSELGSHFGSLKQSNAIVEGGAFTPHTIPAYLSIQNPIRLRDLGEFTPDYVLDQIEDKIGELDLNEDEYALLAEETGPETRTAQQALIQRVLKDAGYDGVVYLNRREGIDTAGEDLEDINSLTDKEFLARFPDAKDSWIVFDPQQVKSALSNTGEYNPNDARINRHRTGPHPLSWNAPAIGGRIEKLQFELQDKHVDTKKVVAAINEARGAAIPDVQDVYLKEELFHGRAAKQTDDFLNRELKPLLNDMAMRKVSLADLEEYLHNRHAEERNIQIAKINPALPDGGSGIKTADARRYLSSLSVDKKAAYVALARRVDAIIARTNQLLVAEGLESQSTINNWNRAYSHYVPLHRADMGEDGSSGTGSGYSVKGPSSKRATGSTLPVANIIANIAINRERQIVRAAKNKVAMALVNLAEANPNPGFWTVDIPDTIKYVGPNGLVVEQADPLWKSRAHVVTAKMLDSNGNVIERAVTFNKRDERAVRMAGALKNLTAPELGAVLGAFGKVTRYFAAINTQYNPIFGMVNLTRDVQSAFFNLTSTAIAGKQLAVARKILPALIGALRTVRAERNGTTPRSAWATTYEEFLKAGGQTGYRDMFVTPATRSKELQREVDRAQGRKLTAAPRAVLQWVGGWLADYNTAMENSTRLAAYKVARDSGVSLERSASLAKNLTVNFNRKGNMASQMGALYAFFNASMQGTARLYETLSGPKGKQIIAGGLLLGVMQALALAAAGFDDDDPPEFVRERSLIIPIGDKKYVTIPMPLGLNVIPSIGRIATEAALSGGRNVGDKAVGLMTLIASTFNPIGGSGTIAQTVSPTISDPAIALLENRDWTGKPIEREDMNPLNPSPGHERAKEKATPWARAMSEAINMLTNGTEYTPGYLSPTPDAIDYLIGQVTGGVGREVSKGAATLSALGTGEDLPAHKIPLVGRFYGNAEGQSKEGAAFYRNVIEINKAEREVKGREANDEDVDGYKAGNPLTELIEEAGKIESRVKKLRKERRELVKSDAHPADVREIEAEITDAMKELNDMVKAVQR